MGRDGNTTENMLKTWAFSWHSYYQKDYFSSTVWRNKDLDERKHAYKVLVIGAVSSTATTLEKLLEHQFDVVGVIGQEPENKEIVSGHMISENLQRNITSLLWAFKESMTQSTLNGKREKLWSYICCRVLTIKPSSLGLVFRHLAL